MTYLLETNHLTKTIKDKDLVSNINLHVKKGEIYGFLGPNGAGKTTIMKMIMNFWKPTSGDIELFGEILTPSSYKVLKRIGSIIEFPTFFDHLSGKENLKLHCEYMGYYQPGSIDEALDMLSLTSAADKTVKNYSLGMKQRLGIARAILCKPEFLILDEPANGLDPSGIKQTRDLFHMLNSKYHTTILISSHILSEIESIADTVGIISHGQLKKEISMKEISDINTEYIELSVENTKKAAYILSDRLAFTNFKIIDEHNIRIYETKVPIQEITKTLATNDITFYSINKKSESLEDFFLKTTMEGEK
ncbi:MAG: ATP-binding cassette domain-containing protein [Lachnospiraceae bacterium]|nr:ATP-binding cassette domain-containing protein [Lachnospiraceae bacterium]